MATWSEERPAGDYRRILAPDGSLVGSPPDLDADDLLAFYRTLVLTRAFDAKALRLQRRGEISIHARSTGEEATPLGATAALDPGDWCFPSYRQAAGYFYWGASMARTFASLMGAPPETVDEHLPVPEGEEPAVNFAPWYVALASNLPNAVGSAMADALRGRDTVSLAFLGEGSTSEGSFHESMNFAGVFDAPAVVICQNNQWAISVPAHRQTASETFATKAEAYGIPHERVDGNDVLAVYDRTRAAVERARAGGGPTFLECVTYRLGEHNTADDEAVYRDEDEADYWAERDPIDRLETHLRDEGRIDDDAVEEVRGRATARVEEAVEAARAVPGPDPERMFDHHLHGGSWTERRQRAELRAEREGRNPFTDVAHGGFGGRDRDGPSDTADGDAREMNMVTALNRGLREEMARDERVRVLGYDVGPLGGVYRVTEGLYEEFGDDRVIDTPLSENAVLGTAVGMAMRGERPVAEIQFMGFFYPAFGQFVYTLAKLYERSGGSIEVPLTVRIPYGGGIKASEYHSESTEAYLIHTPGVRVVCPSTPREAKGLLAASVRHPDPVAFLEPKKIYRGGTEQVPEGDYTLALDRARIAREGGDVTLVTWGAMFRHAVAAADRVDADVEIVDLRTLSPLDVETVLDSVRKTGRCVVLHEARRTLGLGAEISALINEHAIDWLEAPVKRATGYDVHFPSHDNEAAYLPDADRAEMAIEAVMDHGF